MMEFCDRDTTIGQWKTGHNNINDIMVPSVYMDIILPGVWPAAFEQLQDFCNSRKNKVLICGNTNVWSTVWGSRELNNRGKALEDLIFSKNLKIINKGSQPTFFTCRAASTIDVILVTEKTTNLVRNWRVLPDDFSSDHRLIKFGITISAQPPMFSPNWKLGDFCIFRKILEELMTSTQV